MWLKYNLEKFIMFFIKKITKNNISEVSHLIRPFYQSNLSKGLNQSICYALYCVDITVGLVFGEVDKASNEFIIKQLSLNDNFKGRKLEELLLNEIELSVTERNEKEIVCSSLVMEGESADYKMNILKENGWQEPYLIGYLFSIDKEVINWKWLNLLPLEKGMKTCKWNQLPGELIDKLVIEQNTNRSSDHNILKYLSDNKFSSERSAALVIDENIIGWMFVEETDFNRFIISRVYVENQFHISGKSTANLFKETISDVEFPSEFIFIFMVNADNQKLYYFLNRKWRPYISSLYWEYYSKKKL